MVINKTHILYLPTDTGGHAWGLHEGLKRLGVSSDVLYTRKSKFGFPSTILLDLDGKNKIYKAVKKLTFFALAIFRYNIFHYVNASFFLPYGVDLMILKWLRKKIFVTYNGSAVRLQLYAKEHYQVSQYFYNGNSRHPKIYYTDEEKRKKHYLWNKYAKTIFCLNPDLCVYSQLNRFIPYAKPSFYQNRSRLSRTEGEKIKIVHVPSDRIIKGSDFIEQAIDILKTRYSNFSFELVENVDNATVIEKLSQADLLIDQLMVGWYGGVAVEAMKMGVPVIAYVREEDLIYLPSDMRNEIPLINASPESIYNVLEHVIMNADILDDYSKRSISYVKKYHNPEYVAGIVLASYESVAG